MGQIIYAMQFQGQGTPVSESPMVIKAATSCQSCSISSVVGPGGLESGIQAASGGEATFESQVEMTSESTFKESGSISFGEGNVIQFDTLGEGNIGPGAEEGVNHGAVSWSIIGGQGQFEGATGIITSNFTLDGSLKLIDNQFGVINVK